MFDEFGRAKQRLGQTTERIRVGKLSGAVGTHAHLDPAIEHSVCSKLGLKPATLSTQIIQRDRHAEFCSTLALIASSIDRWATEFRHLQRTEVLEVEEFFSQGQKGPTRDQRNSGMSSLEQSRFLADEIRVVADRQEAELAAVHSDQKNQTKRSDQCLGQYND